MSVLTVWRNRNAGGCCGTNPKEDCFFLSKISFSSECTKCLWIGSSTALFVFNPASVELEAALHFKEFQSLSVQVAGSCAVMSEAMSPKVSSEICVVGGSVQRTFLCSDMYLFVVTTVLVVFHM